MSCAQRLTGAVLALLATTLGAQTGDEQALFEEIVVTARKAEERLQEVPLAITAFTADEMVRRNMRELEDVAHATSGLAYEDYGGGYGVAVIRGGAQLRIQDLDHTTSIYLDGIYLPRQYMVDLGVAGFERIEVVKGPQSALFGRNAFLGAVNYVSGGPGDELGGTVQVTTGTDERLDYYGEVGGPIIADVLGLRLLASYSEFDGTWPNEHPNAARYGNRGTVGNLGGWDNLTLGLNVEFRPTEQVAFDLDYYSVERFQETKGSVRIEAPGDTNCSRTFFGGAADRFYCGELPTTFSPLPGGSPPGTKAISDPRAYLLDVESDFIHAGAAFDFSENWRIAYQFGNVDSEVVAAGAGDRDPTLGSFNFFNPAVPVNYVNVTPAGTSEYMSHEIRVEFGQGPLSASLGAFRSEIKDFDLFDFAFAPLSGTEPFNVDPNDGISGITALALTRARTVVDTDAIFGSIGWESSDGLWRVGAEARVTDESKFLDSNTRVADSPKFEDSWSPFTPRFTVDYRMNDDRMVYASLAKGAKSGGFNNTVFNEGQRSFEPDENWTFEVGSKNTLLDGRWLANVAVYYTDWSNLQINTSPTDLPPGVLAPAIVANTGGAKIWGIELDGAWAATENFTLDYAVSFSNAEYESGAISGRIGSLGACDGVACPIDGAIGGNDIQRQPPFQANVGATFSGTLAAGWDWFLRGDVIHQTKQYIDEMNLAWLPDRTLVHARFQVGNGPWTAALWARNLMDEEYATSAFFIATGFGTSYVPIFADKQTLGLTISYEL